MPERYPPEDPQEWLNRARSNLLQAKAKRKGTYLEDLCFNAQQAKEQELLPDFLTDFFCELLGDTRPRSSRVILSITVHGLL